MIHQIVMPDMGATGEDIVVGQWLVTEGDYVKAGQPILNVETDKATTELEAFCEGYLRKILVKEGETVIIPAHSTFDLKVRKPASYVCMYQ